MSTIEQKLADIRRRSEQGGPKTMQLGGDPNAKVWPAETWKICDSQADVAPMLRAITALLETGAAGHQEFLDGWDAAKEFLAEELLERLGGDDEQL